MSSTRARSRPWAANSARAPSRSASCRSGRAGRPMAASKPRPAGGGEMESDPWVRKPRGAGGRPGGVAHRSRGELALGRVAGAIPSRVRCLHMPTLFFTGFPGFLGRELLPRVLERRGDAEAVCLVQEKYAPAARVAADELARAHPHTAGRVRLVAGDITRSDLGIAQRSLAGEVVEIHHLAAVYDLGVARELALRVNVDGTRHVLDLAERCPRLERVHHVSTCYVSGRHPGVFTEDALELGQTFHNHYEETKYLAEVDVRSRMRAGLSATIYRPAIAAGDSATGVTQKYDGPYFIIQWLLRQAGPV